MTCIVGLVEEKVYIGADSLAMTGYVQQTMTATKVFRTKDCIIGYSGTVRMANMLQYGFVPPEHPADMGTDEYLATLFVDAIRSKLKEKGVAAKQNEQETTTGSMLVGYRGRLFKICSDYGLMEASSGFDAVGSGTEIALGAMHATKDMSLQPLKRIHLALEAASDLCHGVRGPFTIVEEL